VSEIRHFKIHDHEVDLVPVSLGYDDIKVIPITCSCAAREIAVVVTAPADPPLIAFRCVGCDREYGSDRRGPAYVIDTTTTDLDEFLATADPRLVAVFTKAWPPVE